MSALGRGLSRGQLFDFAWFQEAWDQAGIEDFAEKWPETFATWMQQLLKEHDQGIGNCVSSFVHTETKRRLSGVVALTLPPTAVAEAAGGQQEACSEKSVA